MSVPGAQAITRALQVLKVIAEGRSNGIAISQLVKETRLNRTTLYRLTAALIAEGMVIQDNNTFNYLIGPECYRLGMIASDRFGIHQIAADSVTRIAHNCGDTAYFSIRSEYYALCILSDYGDYPLRNYTLQPGSRHPLGVGAGALAMLAALPDTEVDIALQTNAYWFDTAFPNYSISLLKEQVLITRQQGYSYNRGLIMAGSWGVGTAICGTDNKVIGALSIAAVESRLQTDRAQQLGELLIKEAALLQNKIKALEKPFKKRPKKL